MRVMDASSEPVTLPAATTRQVEVVAVADVGPRIRRITLGGAELEDFDPLPGQDVVVHLIDEQGNGVRRRYTIRHLDRAALVFDLDVVVHGHGAGSSWGVDVRPGDGVEIFGPRGKVLLADAGWQLFIGDESAVPAIAEMIQALPAGVTALALLEVQDRDDEQPIVSASAAELRWLHRGADPAGQVGLLSAALAAVTLPAADRHAYLFGESRVVRQLREDLGARGFRAEEISAKGYWNTGRASRD
jgi:NADPH-dependent ferric siderophore reductase